MLWPENYPRNLISFALAGKLPEESDQFRFLCATCVSNIKDSVGLISQNLGNEGYYSPRLIYTVFHSSPFAFFALVVPPLFLLLP